MWFWVRIWDKSAASLKMACKQYVGQKSHQYERGEFIMRAPIELTTGADVKRFSDAVQSIECDVRLVGRDENGYAWELSAKSLFSSLIVAAKVQKRAHTAHEVDWNTIWCECEKDIYSVIKDFIKE